MGLKADPDLIKVNCDTILQKHMRFWGTIIGSSGRGGWEWELVYVLSYSLSWLAKRLTDFI
jgi:hypothetical protein